MMMMESRKNDFHEFIRKSDSLDLIKDYILSKDFFARADFPSEYLYYPEIFSGPFFIKDEDKVRLVNIAGYLYLRSIIIFDRMVDRREWDTTELTLLTQFQEISIKILSEIYVKQPNFWKKWNERKTEYFWAAKKEKEGTKLSIELFEKLSDRKSAFGKVAIDAMYLLSGGAKQSVYEDLLESHRLFSCGFQVLDDIQDFKEDWQNKQPNICVSILFERLSTNEINTLSLDVLHKQAYIKGVVSELLSKGINYLERSKLIVLDIRDELESWFNLIDLKLNELKTFSLQLDGYEKVLVSKKYLSNTKLASKSIEESLIRANNFIMSLQRPDGSWEDFCLSAGISNVWTTAFVGYHLPIINSDSNIRVAKAGEFLIENRQAFLWGYNNDWVPDGDSTTWALMMLHKLGYNVEEEVNKWLVFQNLDGGFSTYKVDSNIQSAILAPYDNIDGWVQSHSCVSAVAYYFLSKYRRSCVEFKNVESYMLDRIESGSLNAYWWTSPLYSYVYCISALLNSKSALYYDLSEFTQRIMAKQKSDGSFSDGFIEGNVFYTALVSWLLTSNSKLYEENRESVESSVNWLIENQMSDGSFDSSTCLRVPSSHVTEPNNVGKWKIGNSKTNIVTTDHSRLFSTTLACAALNQFISLSKGLSNKSILVDEC